MNQLNQLVGSFIRPRYMRTLIGRYGVTRTTVLLSLAGFLLSLVVMTPINLLTDGSFVTGIVVAAIICCTILPFHLYQLGHLIADLERAHHALYAAATTDELTQAHNRRYFVEQLRLLCNTQAQQPCFAVVLLDIDDFKAVNDTLGHDAGDRVLQRISQICIANKRATDLFARYGGEEFVFLLPHANQQTALQVAEKMRLAIAQTIFTYNHYQTHCTVSIGIIAVNESRVTPDSLLTAADQALYAAKRNGKNQVTLFGSHVQPVDMPLVAYSEYTSLPITTVDDGAVRFRPDGIAQSV